IVALALACRGMETRTSGRNIVSRLNSALTLIRHDRWQLAAVDDERLQLLAAGPRNGTPAPAAAGRFTPITPLAHRALVERRTVVVSTLCVAPASDGVKEDWERDCATKLYAPVGLPQRRPAGLLSIGCREVHWYEDVDVDYVSSLASGLVDFVSDAADPLRRLSRTERIVVNLISGGCARDEIARALGVPSGDAEGIVSGILRKLRLRSTSEIPPLVERRLL